MLIDFMTALFFFLSGSMILIGIFYLATKAVAALGDLND
jgi:hypothetical protein